MIKYKPINGETRLDMLNRMSKGFDYYQSAIKHVSIIKKAKEDIVAWIEENRHINGQPFSYKNTIPMSYNNGAGELSKEDLKKQKKPYIHYRPYIKQILEDKTREITIIKSRQTEFSENAVNIGLYHCFTKKGFKVFHLFPTMAMGENVSKEKIRTAINGSPVIKNGVISANVRDYAFSNSSMYRIGGSFAIDSARGLSNDMIIFDEVEFHKQTTRDIVLQTLSKSPHKTVLNISTPLLPTGKVMQLYESGSRYEWVQVCPHCGFEQVMQFPDSIINYFEVDDYSPVDKRYDNVYIGCVKCKGYIDRGDVKHFAKNYWKAGRPELIGYHNTYRVSPFITPWKTGKMILMKYHDLKRKNYLHQFYNEELGEVFDFQGSTISENDVLQCVKDIGIDRSENTRFISVGVDWGNESWVVVREYTKDKKTRILNAIRLSPELNSVGGQKHAEKVLEVALRYNADIVVNDANGIGSDRNAILYQNSKNYKYKSFGCFYDTAENQRQRTRRDLVKSTFSDGKVVVSRKNTFYDLIRELKDRDVIISRGFNISIFIKHHADISIIPMIDDNDQTYEIVSSRTGEDHFAHANNYSKIGLDYMIENKNIRSASILWSGRR